MTPQPSPINHTPFSPRPSTLNPRVSNVNATPLHESLAQGGDRYAAAGAVRDFGFDAVLGMGHQWSRFRVMDYAPEYRLKALRLQGLTLTKDQRA